jgi:hypothetical protein
MLRDCLRAIVYGRADDLTEAVFRFLKLPNWRMNLVHAVSLDVLARLQSVT